MLSSSWKGVSWKAKNVAFSRDGKGLQSCEIAKYFISESRRNCLTEMVFGGLYVFHTKRYFLTRLKLRRGNQLDNTQSEESMTSWFQRSQTRKYLNNCPAWSFDKLSVSVSFCQLVNVCFSDWPHRQSPVCCSWNSVFVSLVVLINNNLLRVYVSTVTMPSDCEIVSLIESIVFVWLKKAHDERQNGCSNVNGEGFIRWSITKKSWQRVNESRGWGKESMRRNAISRDVTDPWVNMSQNKNKVFSLADFFVYFYP